MCTRGDSKAAKRARQATRPPVPTSGSEVSARSRASNALSVPTVGSFQSRTTLFAGTCQVHDAEGQPFVVGVYPLLQDETCFFLAVDFDKAGWRDDAAAFLETCRDLESPSRARTITLRARRACLVLLRRGHSGRTCPTTGIARSHRDDGKASGHRPRFVRPVVSEPRHDAARRIWKPDCSAAPEGCTQTGQHGLS